MTSTRTLVMTAAVVAPVVVAGALSLLRALVTGPGGALVLVIVVVAVAATGLRAAGVVAALSSALSFDFFLTEPYYTFAIAGREDIETAVLLIVIGLAVTEVALWGRRQQARSSRREGYLAGVATAARMAVTGSSGLVEVVTRQLTEVLDLDACRFDPTPLLDDSRPRLLPDGRLVWRGRDVDVDRDGLPTMDEIELPVSTGAVVHGVYLLTSATRVRRPDLERRLVAVTLADQVAAAPAAGRAG